VGVESAAAAFVLCTVVYWTLVDGDIKWKVRSCDRGKQKSERLTTTTSINSTGRSVRRRYNDSASCRAAAALGGGGGAERL